MLFGSLLPYFSFSLYTDIDDVDDNDDDDNDNVVPEFSFQSLALFSSCLSNITQSWSMSSLLLLPFFCDDDDNDGDDDDDDFVEVDD